MAYIIQKKTTYEVPENDYRAMVRDVFEMSDGTLRIVFQILSLTNGILNYLAGKNYATGKETIAEDLIEWLGIADAQEVIEPDGSINLEKLKGLHADIRVVHIHNESYDKPFVFVSKISSPGTLTLDSQSAA